MFLCKNVFEHECLSSKSWFVLKIVVCPYTIGEVLNNGFGGGEGGGPKNQGLAPGRGTGEGVWNKYLHKPERLVGLSELGLEGRKFGRQELRLSMHKVIVVVFYEDDLWVADIRWRWRGDRVLKA